MDKIWLKNYDPNVPHTIDPDQYTSIPEMLEESFKKYADSPCFMNFGETLSFKQVDELSQAYAGFLQTECGLVKGDRVAIMMPNCLQYPVALFGALKAGMVNVNISPLYSVNQTHDVLEKTGAKCVLVLANFAHVVQKALPNTQVEHVIITEIGDLFPFFKRLLFNFAIKYIKKMVPPLNIKKAIAFRKTILSTYRTKFKKPLLTGEDLAYLQLTDGRETGTPKCVMLTHRNFIANGLQFTAWTHAISEQCVGKIFFCPLPFFKAIALSGCSLGLTRYGIITNLISNPRDVSTLIKEIKKYPPSFISGIKAVFNHLLLDQDFQNSDFSSLKFTFSGGAAIPKILSEHWQSVTQSIITICYVLTEGAPLITGNTISTQSFTGSVGLPLPSTELKIADEEGQELPLGTRGEIWVKGPQIMKGYWNEPERTKEVLTIDGWFKTGDIAKMDEEGYVYLIDRKEDLIKTEEGIIYPTEVENFITEMNGIQDVIIVKGFSKDKKPIIKAYIVKSDPSLSEDAILSYCKRHLENYQVPDEIEFRDDLPRSGIGYVLRYRLKMEANKYA